MLFGYVYLSYVDVLCLMVSCHFPVGCFLVFLLRNKELFKNTLIMTLPIG